MELYLPTVKFDINAIEGVKKLFRSVFALAISEFINEAIKHVPSELGMARDSFMAIYADPKVTKFVQGTGELVTRSDIHTAPPNRHYQWITLFHVTEGTRSQNAGNFFTDVKLTVKDVQATFEFFPLAHYKKNYFEINDTTHVTHARDITVNPIIFHPIRTPQVPTPWRSMILGMQAAEAVLQNSWNIDHLVDKFFTLRDLSVEAPSKVTKLALSRLNAVFKL